MNKRQARQEALENKRTVAELRQMVLAAKDRGGMSRVNPIVPLTRACEAYEGTLAPHPDAFVPKGWDLMRNDKMGPTRWALSITNILRDCA